MKPLIVSFTHTNYCIRSAGTEKFVRNISKILEKNGICHLNFFSFYDGEKKINKKLVGVNYNDKFVGIYQYRDVQSIICDFLVKKDVYLCAFHLQHLLNHNLEVLRKVVDFFNIPVYIFIHDYYIVCNELKLINSNNVFCGVSEPNACKCMNCSYKEKGISHFGLVRFFLASIEQNIREMIAPSEYVADNLKMIYPNLEKKIIVRPHLLLHGYKTDNLKTQKVKLAYAGGQFSAKGYDEWKKLVETLRKIAPDKYEFYYFGNGNEKLEGVQNIYISNAKQGDDAMRNSISEHSIDCAFLWPNWAETYSYVFYELAINNVFILTNSISGNICAEVQKYENGKVFKCFDECIDWLGDYSNVLNIINKYKKEGIYKPESYDENDAIDMLFQDDKTYQVKEKYNHVYKNMFYTLLYRFKYKDLL